MNKRIKKKRMRPVKVDASTYRFTSHGMSYEINKIIVSHMTILRLHSHFKGPLPKWSQPRINGLMNYIYKNIMRLYQTYEYRGLVSSLDITIKPKTILPLNTPYSPIIRKDC